MATTAACAPIKPTPPPEPTAISHCFPDETDVGNDDIPSLPHDGDSLQFVTGDLTYGVSIYKFTRRGNTICVTKGSLDFGGSSNWTDPRA